MGRLWSAQEDQFLHDNYEALSPREIAEQIGRASEPVVWRAGVLGIRNPRNPPWSAAENSFLRENYRRMQITEICSHLERSYSAVQQQAALLGISKIGRPDSAWTADEDELLSSLYGSMGPAQIAGFLGRTRSAVVHRAMKTGVNKQSRNAKPPRPRIVTVSSMRREATVHDYFAQIDTPVKAYLLGWLASDGNVKTDTDEIRFRIAADDEEALRLARDEFAPLHKITYYRRPNGKKLMGSLRVTSEQMKRDLIRLGVTPNKTLTLQYPPIPPHLDASFILGYFDGDGSLFREAGCYWRWNITSGSHPFLVAIQDRMECATKIRPRGPYAKGGENRAASIVLNGPARIAPVDAWLHADVPGLSRKRLPDLTATRAQ